MDEESGIRTCHRLPEYLAIVLGRLVAAEIQRLRLVSKDWRRAVSDAFVGKLQPMQLEPAAVAFPNATALGLSCKGFQRELLRRISLHRPA